MNKHGLQETRKISEVQYIGELYDTAVWETYSTIAYVNSLHIMLLVILYKRNIYTVAIRECTEWAISRLTLEVILN